MNIKLRISVTFILMVRTLLVSYSQECIHANEAMQLQNYQLAIDLFEQCYQLDTINKGPLASIANCYYAIGDYAYAKEYFHLLEKDSTWKVESASKLASIYEYQQNLPKAIKYYTILQIEFPNNPIYLRKLGALYNMGRERRQAIESYQKSLALNPRDVVGIQSLAEMYMELDSIALADKLIIDGLRVDSTNIGLGLLQARLKYKLRDYKTTVDILSNLSWQTELNNYYNKLLGYSMMQIDSLDKAIFYLQKSLLEERSPEHALYYLGIAHERKLLFTEAKWFYSEAIRSGISENLSQYYNGLARLYTHEKNYKKVIEVYKRSLQYNDNPEILFYLANASEIYYKNKQVAMQYYDNYVKSGHQNVELLHIAKERLKKLKEEKFMNSKR